MSECTAAGKVSAHSDQTAMTLQCRVVSADNSFSESCHGCWKSTLHCVHAPTDELTELQQCLKTFVCILHPVIITSGKTPLGVCVGYQAKQPVKHFMSGLSAWTHTKDACGAVASKPYPTHTYAHTQEKVRITSIEQEASASCVVPVGCCEAASTAAVINSSCG